MFLKKLKLSFGSKVCGQLHAELVEKYERLEIQCATQEIRRRAAAKKNQELTEKISDWYYRYHQLKLTFSVAMTETPTFENYESVMESKNENIEHLENLVHELSFKNRELAQSLEKVKLQDKSTQWRSGLEDLDRAYLSNQIPTFKNLKVF